MSTSVEKQIRVRVRDPDIVEGLERVDNISEVTRRALRDYFGDIAPSVELSDREESAYRELLKLTKGGGTVRLDVAATVLAQAVGLEKAVIRPAVFEPLESEGLIEPRQTWKEVFIRVYSPEEVDVDA
jgi:hypothetical protein